MYELTPFENGSVFNYFDSWGKDFWKSELYSGNFKADIVDKGDKYLLQAELPGFDKEDIFVDLDGEYLTIQASKSDTEKSSTEKFVRKERRFSSFERSFNLAGVETDSITAQYKNGILELELPKAKESHTSSKKIQIN